MINKFGLFESINKAKMFFEDLVTKNDFDKILNIDKSSNHKDLSAMLYFFIKKEASYEDLEKYFELYNIFRNVVGPLEYVKKEDKVLLKGEPITFLKLSEIVDGYNSRRLRKKLGSEKYEMDSDLKPIWSNERYSIFLADTQNKCVELGRGQTFCISRGDTRNLWPNYRKSDVATFYFIFDKKPNKESEGLVVVDARGNGQHVITDKNNSTGYKQFEQYLIENPDLIEVKNLFKNKPYSELERVLMTSKMDFNNFKSLSPGVQDEYLSMGRDLDNGVWDILSSDQKNIYINSGAWLNSDIVKTLTESQTKRYNSLCWRKIENRSINNISNFTPNQEEIHFLRQFSFTDILKSDVSKKAQTAIIGYYLKNKLYDKISDQDLLNIVKVSPSLLSHVKGLSMKQMVNISKYLQKDK